MFIRTPSSDKKIEHAMKALSTTGHPGPLPRLRGLVTLVTAVILWSASTPLHAQWTTQTNALRGGWNAVFMHVDASHATLDDLVGKDASNPIQEIWYWQPKQPTGQFVESPQLPTGGGSQWVNWIRNLGTPSELQRLIPNAAYLVKLDTNAAPYDWKVKGKPLAPTYQWTLTGLNFLGFPTPPSPVTAQPFWENFLAQSPSLQQSAEIYRYQGGEFGPTNPARLLAFRTTRMRRDQAVWIRAGENYNTYFGPIQILPLSGNGLHFGKLKGQERVRIRNQASTPITVTLRQLPSEAAPADQTPIQGEPTLLVRGVINSTNLTYSYSNLKGGLQQWNLAAAGDAGSEVEIYLGLNRSTLTGPVGALHAGILRFTDSLGLSQIDIGVSAERASSAGLWVGEASIGSIAHRLKPYASATNALDFQAVLNRLHLTEGNNGIHYEWNSNSGRILVFGGPEKKTGSYLLDGSIKIDAGEVATPYPLRLIVHNDGSASRLLQKVYYGIGVASNAVLATRESSLLPSQLTSARRISSVHLPTSDANIPWTLTGSMASGASLTGSVPLAYNDTTSNPFLHNYHPDHDNLDAQFKTQLARGLESYGIVRELNLSFTSPPDNFDALTRGSQDLSGQYGETITVQGRESQSRQYYLSGTFSLKRISDIATLTTQ